MDEGAGSTIAIATLLAQYIVAQPLPVPADVANARWELVTAQAGGRLFIDPASIARARGKVRFRIRIFADNPGPGLARSIVVETEFDCARRTATVHSERTLDADGGLLRAREIPAGQRRVRPIRRDSPLNQAVHARVCSASPAGTERGPGQ